MDETALSRVAAAEEIRNLVANYAHGVDKQDEERFLGVWTANAIWIQAPGAEPITGLEAITRSVRAIWEMGRQTHHWSTNHAIDVHAGGSAQGLVDVLVVSHADGAWFRTAGSYRDEYRNLDGVWKIARREVDLHHRVRLAEPDRG